MVSLSSSKLTEHKEWGVTGTPIYRELEALGSTSNYHLATVWLQLAAVWHVAIPQIWSQRSFWSTLSREQRKAFPWSRMSPRWKKKQNDGFPQCTSPQAGCLPLTKTVIYTKCLLFSHWPVTSERRMAHKAASSHSLGEKGQQRLKTVIKAKDSYGFPWCFQVRGMWQGKVVASQESAATQALSKRLRCLLCGGAI